MPQNPNAAGKLMPDDSADKQNGKAEAPKKGKEAFIYTRSEPPEVAHIDEGWSLEPTPDSVSAEMGAQAKTVALPEIHVTAEDGLKPGQEALTDLLDEHGISYPEYLRIYSGDNTHASDRMPFEDSVIAIDTSAGDIPTNADGTALMLDEKEKKLMIVMAHGPQHDPMAANLANVVATKGAVEFATSKPKNMVDVGRRIDSDVAAASEDLGVELSDQKPLDYLVASLEPGAEYYHLRVAGRGKMQCVILNPQEGDVTVLPEFKHSITSEQIQETWDMVAKKTSPEGIEELVKKMSTGAETPEALARVRERLQQRMTPKNRADLFMDWVEGQLPHHQRDAFHYYMRRALTEDGLPPEKISEAAVSYFEQPLYFGQALEEGEVVIMATPEVADYLKKQRSSLAMRYFLELSEGTHLDKIGNDLTNEVLQAQKDGKIPDSSVSIVAVQAPPTETVKAHKGEQASMDEEIEEILKRT